MLVLDSEILRNGRNILACFCKKKINLNIEVGNEAIVRVCIDNGCAGILDLSSHAEAVLHLLHHGSLGHVVEVSVEFSVGASL